MSLLTSLRVRHRIAERVGPDQHRQHSLGRGCAAKSSRRQPIHFDRLQHAFTADEVDDALPGDRVLDRPFAALYQGAGTGGEAGRIGQIQFVPLPLFPYS